MKKSTEFFHFFLQLKRILYITWVFRNENWCCFRFDKLYSVMLQEAST